jgi:formylglycine-generating enzyme
MARQLASIVSHLILLSATACILPGSAKAITIPTVPVGNAGNPDDTTGYGGVSYAYRMGTTEVTLNQYTSFLNAVAKTDTFGLYDPQMATDLNVAGISRSGVPGNYSYSVIGSANKPVTYVSWGSAARFTNWLQNGQPSGLQNASTTENGAYNLTRVSDPIQLTSVTREPGATWFIPNADEWYKAAFHKNDGVTADYWKYPTSSDVAPTSTAPPGNTAPTPSNTANYRSDQGSAYAVTGSSVYDSTQNYLTDVGAYLLATSPYGTFDQADNVAEWTEARITPFSRGTLGGEWADGSAPMASNAYFGFAGSTYTDSRIGFRVATVPEPGTVLLFVSGSIMIITGRFVRRRLF